MKSLVRALESMFVLFLSLLLMTPQNVLAQDHVVSPSDIQRDIAAASSARQRNLSQLQSFFSSPQAQGAMKSVHIPYQEINSAVQQLSNDDLARLSVRAEKAQMDFAAGALTQRDLIYILIGIAALILIIVAVR